MIDRMLLQKTTGRKTRVAGADDNDVRGTGFCIQDVILVTC